MKPKRINLKMQISSRGNSEDTESSSDVEVVPPKPLKTKPKFKYEFRNSESSSDEEVAPPRPIQTKQEFNYKSDETETGLDEELTPPKFKPIKEQFNEPFENSEGSSDEKVAPPKPVQIKQEFNQELFDDSGSSSGEEVARPKPVQIKQEFNQGLFEDSGSSSGEEVARPKLVQNMHPYGRGSDDSNSSSAENKSPSRARELLAQASTSQAFNSDSEDDESRSKLIRLQTPVQFEQMDYIDKLKLKYPGIKKQTCDVKFPEDAKYSLVLVPKTIDPQGLVNKKCHLEKESLVILNEQEYIFQPSSKKPDPVLLSVDGGKIVQPESVQVLQRYVSKLVAKVPEVVLRENIALPTDLKQRHPLFGVNYKEKLHLDKSVKVKLHDAAENRQKVDRKLIRKKNKKKKKSQSVEEVDEKVMQFLNSIDGFVDLGPPSPAKKQKAKRSLQELGRQEGNAKPKKKSKRDK